MSGRQAFTQNTIRDQLCTVEFLIKCQYSDNLDWIWLKYRRYYLLRRLLALQLKEFDNGDPYPAYTAKMYGD